ncbi:MAG: acetyltransferase [Pseudomonadota bacterium]|nr:MAG: acetyltransferase [Pseudomonadota bacterium]
MAHFDVFNGDADGICALHQLRLALPIDSELVTGVKRDIDLLRRVDAGEGDEVTVLDVSLDKNREPLEALLAAGARIHYFDHHFAGEIPSHPGLQAHIDTAPEVCTSLLVNDFLGGKHLPWAVTAAFGDNLEESAHRAAAPLDLDEARLAELQMLGICLNYNGYGVKLEDLFFAPDELYRRVRPYEDPFAFINDDPAYGRLREGYAGDMAQAESLKAEVEGDTSALYLLPDAAWARRISGVLANQLARSAPQRAHALVTELPDGAFRVSVRAPLSNRQGADDLCREFPTGGGRAAAAGINRLDPKLYAAFVDRFRSAFSG